MKTKAFREMYKEDEIKKILGDLGTDFSNEIDFEGFLRVSHLCLLLFQFYPLGRAHTNFVDL